MVSPQNNMIIKFIKFPKWYLVNVETHSSKWMSWHFLYHLPGHVSTLGSVEAETYLCFIICYILNSQVWYYKTKHKTNKKCL